MRERVVVWFFNCRLWDFFFFFRVVLCSKQNLEEDREISPRSHTCTASAIFHLPRQWGPFVVNWRNDIECRNHPSLPLLLHSQPWLDILQVEPKATRRVHLTKNVEGKEDRLWCPQATIFGVMYFFYFIVIWECLLFLGSCYLIFSLSFLSKPTLRSSIPFKVL